MEIKENNEFKFWIEDGILYSQFKIPLDINMELSKQFIELRHQISNNKKHYWCYDLYNMKSFSKESRDYADKHGQDFLHATAAIVHSHMTRFFVNIFVKIKIPKIPFKAFNDKESAIKWLKEQKAHNESMGIF